MRTINLKSPIVFRVKVVDKDVAFSTRTFRGERASHVGTIPDKNDRITYRVSEIVLDGSDPWFRLSEPLRLTIAWSHVVSEQDEEA